MTSHSSFLNVNKIEFSAVMLSIMPTNNDNNHVLA